MNSAVGPCRMVCVVGRHFLCSISLVLSKEIHYHIPDDESVSLQLATWRCINYQRTPRVTWMEVLVFLDFVIFCHVPGALVPQGGRSIKPYDPNSDFIEWVESLKQSFIASGLEDAMKQWGIFLTEIGPKTYKFFSSLLSPLKPETVLLETLIDKFSKHKTPTRTHVVQRFRFNIPFATWIVFHVIKLIFRILVTPCGEIEVYFNRKYNVMLIKINITSLEPN